MRRFDERLIAGWLLALTIAAGYAAPGLSVVFEPYAQPALFTMIVASLIPMARLRLEEVFSLEQDVVKIVGWQLFVLPSLILAACHLLNLSPNLVTLVAVTACAGSLFASPALADLLGLNQHKALQCMVLSTFIMPFSYFVFLTVILHSDLEIEVADFIGRTGLFLMVPAFLFLVYSAYAGDLKEETVKTVERAARHVTIGALLVFGLGIVGPAAELLASDPRRFLMLLAIVTVLGVGMAVLTTIVMYRQGITNALTASIASGFRNVGLGFALIQGSADRDTAAYVGISQIPIFLAPLVMRLFIENGSIEPEASSPEGEANSGERQGNLATA